LGAEELAKMKSDAVLINTARGGLVDEPALVAALKRGRLAGAGLDVFADEPTSPSNPLLGLDSTVLLPHVGGRTRDNLHRMVRHWSNNIRRHAAGEPIAEVDLV
jgi:D-3-phosphoglycerate dehydrogenase